MYTSTFAFIAIFCWLLLLTVSYFFRSIASLCREREFFQSSHTLNIIILLRNVRSISVSVSVSIYLLSVDSDSDEWILKCLRVSRVILSFSIGISVIDICVTTHSVFRLKGLASAHIPFRLQISIFLFSVKAFFFGKKLATLLLRRERSFFT